jgi:hypothetical protein
MQHTNEKDFTAKKVGDNFAADDFINPKWPDAGKGDVANISLIDFSTQMIELKRYIKTEYNVTAGGSINYGNWELITE